ncbi:MAG: DUF4159 domain-containing protein [Parvularculaceae bacterium]
MLPALSFGAPLVLIALAALPAIWLLLRATPPSPKRLSFPAFVILRQLETKEETPQRTPWPLLLLRLLLATLAIAGLSGPILNAPKAVPTAGPLVFVIDDSWAAASTWGMRRNALRAGAEEAARSNRMIFIVTTADPRPGAMLGPLTGEEARKIADAISPQPFRADRAGAVQRLAELEDALARLGGSAEIRWLSDGLSGDGDKDLEDRLNELGAQTIYAEPTAMALRTLPPSGDNRVYRLERLDGDAAWSGSLVATSRSGRELARARAEMAANVLSIDVSIDLPLALRNDIASVAIDDVASAGAVQLADARERRALVGLIAGADGRVDEFVSGSYFIRRALEPYAAFIDGALDDLLKSDVSVIILDDIGRLRPGDVAGLQKWIESGGVAIRFAGPNLADAAQEADPPLLPVKLRGGGRAFGGALTWETPQRLAAFSETGPFGDLAVPDDVFVREQVLAAPGGETSERSWASIADGTPIVTGMKMGSGALALFHAPATPSWSDLPISATFVEMMRRLVYLSILGPDRSESDANARLAPFRVLDGFGAFAKPRPDAQNIAPGEARLGAAPGRPPGLYGAPEAPIAVNAMSIDALFSRLAPSGVNVVPYAEAPPVRLDAPLLAAALFLLLVDGLITLLYSGRLRFPVAASLFLAFAAPVHDASAQPIEAPIDNRVLETALKTRLAYVRTGDPQVDRISERGLSGLTAELFKRTAVEPAPPIAIDPETDDLSVYPLIYWPIVAGASTPTESALGNLETFMRFGGLLVFDTRDDERSAAGASTPEQSALRDILGQLDVPPLMPLPRDHVLTKSFYLLTDLPGRTADAVVWVQAQGSANDGVTPIIIGGRDWASAWATDDFGRPLRAVMGRGDCVANAEPGKEPTVQECAFRAGINIAMVAYTGNYKSDLVHTTILLQRLER